MHYCLTALFLSLLSGIYRQGRIGCTNWGPFWVTQPLRIAIEYLKSRPPDQTRRRDGWTYLERESGGGIYLKGRSSQRPTSRRDQKHSFLYNWLFRHFESRRHPTLLYLPHLFYSFKQNQTQKDSRHVSYGRGRHSFLRSTFLNDNLAWSIADEEVRPSRLYG